jgi:hypothetical protein
MRSHYFVFLTLSVAWFLALGLFAGPIASVIGIFHPILFVASAIGFTIIAGQFGCSYCAHSLVRPKMTVGSREITGYSLFPSATCTNCGQSVDQG